MKKIALITALLLALSGCTSGNSYGECKGFAEDDDPRVEYGVSVWNVFLAVFFSETIIVPVVTAADSWKCPKGWKPNYNAPAVP